jgi:hypothetical protein
MKISILHPSRKRAEKSFHTINKFWNRRGDDVDLQIIVSLDFDDPTTDDYFDVYSDANFEHKIIINENRSAVDAINNAAKSSDGDILFVVSDDTDCIDGWANEIIWQTQNKKDWVAKTQDGIQEWIITAPIMDRTYYNRFGYIYYPEYLHMFCDTELTCVADLTGRKIEIHIPFMHNHYSIGKSTKDEVSFAADKTWRQGEALFSDRAKRKFDLKDTPGKITSPDYVNWLNKKGIRI